MQNQYPPQDHQSGDWIIILLLAFLVIAAMGWVWAEADNAILRHRLSLYENQEVRV